MAQLPRDKTVTPKPEPHVHQWPEHLHKPSDPCDSSCPKAVCFCGAKLVVVEPGPVMVNCYWGVVGHSGHRLDHCRNQIVKGQEPPYCAHHQIRLKVDNALEALKGKVITEVILDEWQCVTIHWKDGDGGKFTFEGDYDDDCGFEWRLA